MAAASLSVRARRNALATANERDPGMNSVPSVDAEAAAMAPAASERGPKRTYASAMAVKGSRLSADLVIGSLNR